MTVPEHPDEEAFNSPEEAAQHFGLAFQQTAGCICEAAFKYPAAQPLDRTRALVLGGGGDNPLGDGLYLYAAHTYTVTRDRGGYVVRTGGYWYSVSSDESGGELVAWHWHVEGPSWCKWPHLHARSSLGDHLPTGRVAFEQVVRWLIHDAGVFPRHQDWEELLDRNEQDWRSRRSWA
jgi:hypothetical protein